jgi:hypothetical protein
MPPRLRLRDLPAELRLVLATFLVLAAAGYAAALVQVHYQSAGPDELLPGPDRVREIYSGPRDAPRSQIERLLESDRGPMNGFGTMRPAFTTQSHDWAALIAKLAPDDLRRLSEEREGERLGLLAWVKTGADRGAYDRDDFTLGPELAGQPVTPALLAGPGRLKVRTLIEERCVGCHSENGRVERARLAPLDGYDRIKPHVEVRASSRMSLPKLAQTTHAHLLGLAILYAATGSLFCFTGVPRGAKFALAPLPLVAQGIDIGCWWLARWEAAFAWGVVAGGAAAGLGLAIHVLGGLWELVGCSCGRARGGLEYDKPHAPAR